MLQPEKPIAQDSSQKSVSYSSNYSSPYIGIPGSRKHAKHPSFSADDASRKRKRSNSQDLNATQHASSVAKHASRDGRQKTQTERSGRTSKNARTVLEKQHVEGLVRLETNSRTSISAASVHRAPTPINLSNDSCLPGSFTLSPTPPTLAPSSSLAVTSPATFSKSLQSSISTKNAALRDTAPTFSQTAVLVTENEDLYTSLSDLEPNKRYNVIGVISHISEEAKKTGTGEWSRSLRLTDRSNHEKHRGFQINCFTPTYKQWLPSGVIGDILILQGLRASVYNHSTVGIGYSNKLRWAIINSSTRQIQYGDTSGAPQSVSGFCPYWTPSTKEASYAIEMSRWWGQRRAGVVRGVDRNLPKEDDHYHALLQRKKDWERKSQDNLLPHRLLKEGLDGEFFSCTVQVTDTVYSDVPGRSYLFITDYSIDSSIPAGHPLFPRASNGGIVPVLLQDSQIDMVTASVRVDGCYSIGKLKLQESPHGSIQGRLGDGDGLIREATPGFSIA